MSAKANKSASALVCPFSLSAPINGVYAPAHGVPLHVLAERLSARQKHLRAMLSVIYGEGGESFRRMNEELQDFYLWACADLSRECDALFDGLHASLMPAICSAEDEQ